MIRFTCIAHQNNQQTVKEASRLRSRDPRANFRPIPSGPLRRSRRAPALLLSGTLHRSTITLTQTRRASRKDVNQPVDRCLRLSGCQQRTLTENCCCVNSGCCSYASVGCHTPLQHNKIARFGAAVQTTLVRPSTTGHPTSTSTGEMLTSNMHVFRQI